MTGRRYAAQLAFALCVITTGVNLQAPLYATYASRDGYGVMATTIAFSFYVAGVLPILLALGGLSDRIGRRRVMLISLFLSAAGTGLMLSYPHIEALGAARFVLGVGTALMSATATAYMIELVGTADTAAAANWVTASTSVGFGLGPALTSAFLLFQETVAPPSFLLHLAFTGVAACLVWKLPETSSKQSGVLSPMLQLPYITREGFWYGCAILLCWATTGLVISILPSVLATHGLSKYSGLSAMLAISCGLLFQPLARKLEPSRSTRLGIFILLPAYSLLAWGAWSGSLAAVLVGSFFASSSCYGFVYLGGLAAVARATGIEKTRASAAYFLMAYIGFSVPVIFTGLIADKYGTPTALIAFGLLLLLGAALLLPSKAASRIRNSAISGDSGQGAGR
ncbi:MAG: MFS transporter [Ramlibacter sp.]|nr:MFS transporter [Ramlibacter sp.]